MSSIVIVRWKQSSAKWGLLRASKKAWLHDSVIEEQLLLGWTSLCRSRSERVRWQGWGLNNFSPSLHCLVNQSNTTCQVDFCMFIGYKSLRGKYVATCCHIQLAIGWVMWMEGWALPVAAQVFQWTSIQLLNTDTYSITYLQTLIYGIQSSLFQVFSVKHL